MHNDWSTPQRQPLQALLVVFVKTAWDVLKRWGILIVLVIIRKAGAEEDTGARWYEYLVYIGTALAIGGSVVQYLTFRFQIAGDELIIRKGLLNRETLSLPLARIQAVHLDAPLVHRMLGLVKVTLDTAGSGKAEGTIDALRRDMAEELRECLLASRAAEGPIPTDEAEDLPLVEESVLLRLSPRQLFWLGLSANHLETALIILGAAFSFYQNIRQSLRRDELDPADWAERAAGLIGTLSLLAIALTLLVSFARTALRFWNFQLRRTGEGFHLRYGLIGVREGVVPFRRIQTATWRANGIRQWMGLWVLEYRLAGNKEAQRKQRIQVPVSHTSAVSVLVEGYLPMPVPNKDYAIAIHPQWVAWRLLTAGILPGVLMGAALYFVGGYWWLAAGAWPLLIGTAAYLRRRKFRAYGTEDGVYIRGGVWGRSHTLLRWDRVQQVRRSQSGRQRRARVATLVLYTAAGTVRLPWIPAAAATEWMDWALYVVEAGMGDE